MENYLQGDESPKKENYDVSQILCSTKKIIFIIIDPFPNDISSNGDDKQRSFLLRFLSILEHNLRTFKQIDAINIIVTKYDRLSKSEREELKERYEMVFYEIERLCRIGDINCQNQYKPKVFYFSIGKIYWDEVFEYDNADSDKIVEYIKNTVCRRNSVWHNFKSKLRGS